MGNKMKKKGKWMAWWGALLCALCCVSVVGGKTTLPVSTAAAEEQGYEWDSVEIISIAPPFTYSSYETASFQVFFDKDITGVNYKHLAAGAAVLKTFNRNDNPNMSPAIIDSLDASGVLDSVNDCIAFNGKTVREWQKLGPLACMVQVGELGVNNSMNIDLNGGVPGAKITDFNQPFTFTFYEGLKFPSGVEVKETVTWQYNPDTQTFSRLEVEAEPNETEFTVYYNGQEITKENNLVTIYDKAAFNLDFLTVETASVRATVEIDPKFEDLADGYNYLLIVVQAENRIDFEHLQIVFDLQQTECLEEKGCSSVTPCVGVFAILSACGLAFVKRSERA